jgi:hypothetical protein
MIPALNIVRGAIAKKTLLPVLTHYRVYGGRIQGGNGRFCIDAPCPELAGHDFCAPAERFIKAVDACDSDPQLHLTEGGRLSISRGTFRALLPLTPNDDYPLEERGRGGEEATTLGDWLPMLRALTPFVGEDASRPAFMGIWLAGDGYAYATNNAILARAPCPWGSLNEPVILPGFLVDELIRLGREPVVVTYSATGITFGFEDGVWLQGRLLSGTWPDGVLTMCKPFDGGAEAGPVADAVRRILPFCPNEVFPEIVMDADGVATADGVMSARVQGGVFPPLRWHGKVLLTMLESATVVDFDSAPIAWRGEGGLVGVAMPLK